VSASTTAGPFQTFAKWTSERDANRILEPSRNAALVVEFESGRRLYITAPEYGAELYLVGYGSGGGLYLNRPITLSQAKSFVQRAHEIDVETDRLPDAVRRPTP